MQNLKPMLAHLRSERNLVIAGLVLSGAVFSAYVQTLYAAVERGQSQSQVQPQANPIRG